jgi:hypothetical protein
MQLLRYPEDRVRGDYDYLRVNVIRYRAPSLGSAAGRAVGGNQLFNLPTGTQVNSNSQTLATIILPMPLSINDTNTTNWDKDSLNSLTLAGFNVASDLVDALSPDEKGNFNLGQAGNLLQSSLGNAYDSLDANTRDLLSKALVGQAVNALGGNIDRNSIISRTTGQVLNPNMELLFRGVTLRSFNFKFEFTPRTPTEGETVKQIIRLFKKEMSARNSSQGTAASQGLFISAPNIFQLNYYRGGRPHPFLNNFKPMALQNITVDYTGAGRYATYEDATPVKMSMSLAFTELNPIYNEDYNGTPGVGF